MKKRLNRRELKSRCRPDCSKETTSVRAVVFRDGTMHGQRYCSTCKRTKFVERHLIPKDTKPVPLSTTKELLSPKDRNGLGEGYGKPQI